MTEVKWKNLLGKLRANHVVLTSMQPHDPMPEARFCRESPHRTLGHLTACQIAWFPLLKQIQKGDSKGSIPIHPYTLFENQGFGTAPWDELISLYEKGREDWIAILGHIYIRQEIQTAKRIWTPQTLTKRLVEHETNHLRDLT
ncbi:MAG: hypothetical protein WCI55_07765 [Armatimonadota bacterium]